ncbi:MAG TPA: hypothetical protein PKM73_17755 [Verrucomicrobiota bacterium]|nr:hypothetical protein [Verrucomicrobiota bacterium]HNU51390.1 hypothetical protein [Verrucomicrobiota bacterium]
MKSPVLLGLLLVLWAFDSLPIAWGNPAPEDPTPPRQYAQVLSPRRYVRPLNTAPTPPTPPAPAPAAPVAKPAAPVAGTAGAVAAKEAEKKAALKRTVDFLKQRAEAGSVSAQFDLGKRYMTGDGVEKNLDQAKKWLEAAAKQEHAGAAAKLEELKKLPPEPAPEKAK